MRETDKAQTLLRQGTALVERILANKTGASKNIFERKFKSAFKQLTVALSIQSKSWQDWKIALEIAEQ